LELFSRLDACSLNREAKRIRLSEWGELLLQATACDEVSNGVRYSFFLAEDVEARIRELAAAEERCCSFLSFTISSSGDRVDLTVTAPADRQELLRHLFSA
jgi:hypothetical protein